MTMSRRNQTIDDALDEARATFAAKRPRSEADHVFAARSMPGGNTRTTLHQAPFPLSIVTGKGAILTDADGFNYVNLLGEYTAGVFGHSHPVIRRAIDSALDHGLNLGAQTRREGELAELVCARFPSVEKVRFTNSGTEANLMAIATARYQTKRSHVMVMRGGYHGGLLYFVSGGSLPINVPFPFVLGSYNDIETTRQAIRTHATDLACVLVEPMMGSTGCLPADPAFLAMLREESAAAGIVMILDEVMTSRFGRGGAQSLLGLKPDMTTFGKWIGGGMSFGAYGGRADLMDLYDPTRPGTLPHAGTFNNNVLTMSAGVAALAEVFTADVAEALHARGDRFRLRLAKVFRAADVPVQVTGIGSLMNLHVVDGPIERPADIARNDEKARELLYFDLIERGIYMGRRGFIALTLALTDADLDRAADAIGDAISARSALLKAQPARPPRGLSYQRQRP
jgi:glutamate-1-semialdehyde 2,1-aminomutase